jgi:hypothetical protein
MKIQSKHISLTPPSNSGWITKTEFGEKETMLSPCLCLGEKISQQYDDTEWDQGEVHHQWHEAED